MDRKAAAAAVLLAAFALWAAFRRPVEEPHKDPKEGRIAIDVQRALDELLEGVIDGRLPLTEAARRFTPIAMTDETARLQYQFERRPFDVRSAELLVWWAWDREEDGDAAAAAALPRLRDEFAELTARLMQ